MHRSRNPRAIALLSLMMITACGTTAASRSEAAGTAELASAPPHLVVGLYPYVPRPNQLQDVIAAAWEATHPEVPLQFDSSWDGGYGGDPRGMDVFVFDAIFLDHFRSAGLLKGLAPGNVSNLGDYLPYAINGAYEDGEYYGLPMFGCANILFYRAGDTQVERASTLTELVNAVGRCTYTSEIPPGQRGLLMDLAGGTTNACMYVDLLHGMAGGWPVPLPATPAQLDPRVIASAKLLLETSSYYDATEDPPNGPYGRAAWFSQGNGRILMGFTEAMSAMNTETRAVVKFKPFPLGDDTSAKPLFYADLIGVSATTTQSDLAIELANLIASTDVLVAGMQGDQSHPPQFLMPARTSIFEKLSATDPLYQRMHDMVVEADPILLNLGVQVRSYIANLKDAIQDQTRTSYGCGCDQDGGTTSSQAQANVHCPKACANYGGWNGQWTPYPPGGTRAWQSGCGCKVCPVP